MTHKHLCCAHQTSDHRELHPTGGEEQDCDKSHFWWRRWPLESDPHHSYSKVWRLNLENWSWSLWPLTSFTEMFLLSLSFSQWTADDEKACFCSGLHTASESARPYGHVDAAWCQIQGMLTHGSHNPLHGTTQRLRLQHSLTLYNDRDELRGIKLTLRPCSFAFIFLYSPHLSSRLRISCCWSWTCPHGPQKTTRGRWSHLKWLRLWRTFWGRRTRSRWTPLVFVPAWAPVQDSMPQLLGFPRNQSQGEKLSLPPLPFCLFFTTLSLLNILFCFSP